MARKCDNAYSCGSIWGVLNKAAIGDERKSRGIRHSMSEILLVILLGFLAGCTSLRSIAGYFAPDNPSLKLERQKLISSIVDLPFGIPDSSTLSRSIKKLNPVPFVVAFAEYMTSLVPHDPNKQINLAIDGKAVVAALNKRTSGYNYYIVNVFAAAYHLF
ncbi:MAG: transposase family protein, partial [Psychrobacillus sp.]